MKRIGYIFEKIIDVDNIKYAIKKACEHKEKDNFINKLLNNADYYAKEISTLLKSGNFKPTIIAHKKVKESVKERDVAIPKFYPDQIIHWAICIQLNKIFMKGMYQFNCGSIPGRGGLYAKNYIERVYKKVKETKTYTAKLDIRKYFNSISHSKLEWLFGKKIKDKKVLTLLHNVINCGEKGLPIGFYTSQWFANFFLVEFDHYIKEQLHIKYYVRYVDDMVLIDTNKKKLHKAIRAIQQYFIDNDYGLELKGNWQVWKTFSRPLDFLGYKFYENYTLLRKRILKKYKRQLRKVKLEKTVKICRAVRIMSYMGWMKHCSVSRSFYKKYVRPVCSKKWVGRIISHDSKRRAKKNGNANNRKKQHRCES